MKLQRRSSGVSGIGDRRVAISCSMQGVVVMLNVVDGRFFISRACAVACGDILCVVCEVEKLPSCGRQLQGTPT